MYIRGEYIFGTRVYTRTRTREIFLPCIRTRIILAKSKKPLNTRVYSKIQIKTRILIITAFQ